jgi:hypothetical protein
LLYELLTGSPPFTRKELEKAGVLEMLRVIREQEPMKPSTKLSTAKGLPALAANRGTEPAKLSRLVGGELDWITMKALEKDRGRRYETANGLARDIERYLRDEPVQACEPSAMYRFRKFARRHKVGLTIAGLILFFVVVLGGGAGWMIRDEAVRQTVLHDKVGQALQEAADCCQRDKLAEALEVVKRAEGLLAGGGSEELRQRVRRWHTDLKMAARLEKIRLERSLLRADGTFDWPAADRAYRKAFRQHDLDALALDPDEAAQRMQASPIKDRLVRGLDDWVLNNWRGKLPGWKRLLAVARRADADPWRDRLRAAFRRRDRKALASLARDKGLLSHSPGTLHLLGVVLVETGGATWRSRFSARGNGGTRTTSGSTTTWPSA